MNFNYRLGPLGFPQGNEAAARGALNLGLKDQLAALEWIQANIGAFGGDKTKVNSFPNSKIIVKVISELYCRLQFLGKVREQYLLQSIFWIPTLGNLLGLA